MTRPFRLTAEHTKERAEHRTLAKWLRVLIGEPATDGYCGTMWFSIDHATSGSDGERIDRWNRGVRRGVPDVVFIRPGGVTCWIELKRIGEDARAPARHRRRRRNRQRRYSIR